MWMKQENFTWRNIAKWINEKKAQKRFATLNYIEHFLVLDSTNAGCIAVSAFVSLPGIPIGSS